MGAWFLYWCSFGTLTFWDRESADMGIGDSELEQLRSAIGEPEE